MYTAARVSHMENLYSRRADVLARETKDGAVLVDIVNGDCWELNRVGAAFWSLLERPTTVPDACDALATRYQVTREVIERDLLALIAELSRAGLITAKSRPLEAATQ